MKQANSVGLSASWKKKVQDGTIDISKVKNEKLAEKIKDYQTWYEKAIDCKKSIEELEQKEAELYKQRFDNVSTKYDGILGVTEHKKNMLDEKVSQEEAKGHVVSTRYYKALSSNAQTNYNQLLQKRKEQEDALSKAVKSGKIKVGSEMWYFICYLV